MTLNGAEIVLDSPNNAYYSGQTIHGRLIYERDKQKTFRGIYIRMRGYCDVHWSTDHTRRVNDRTEHYTVDHNSYEEYIDHKVFLAGGNSGDHHLGPGKHEFPFSIHIPPSCPSNFEGSYGHVRYELKVVVDRAFKLDQEISAPIRIMAPLDLNREQYAKDPIQLQLNDSYCCWCINSGSSETLLKLPLTGYCPGQVMPIELSCSNKSNIEIEKIKIAIKKEVTYRAVNNPDSKSERDKVVEVKKGPVPANSSRSWSVELSVPAIDIYNLNTCSHIDIEYELKVTVSPEGCHDDTEDSCLLILGTVPLVGYQDNVQNPMQDQMPQQPIITTQVQNYPGNNTAYPTPIINQPLPTVSPYPGAAPYPGANPPYPGAAPYPGANPPYPGANPPYPGQNSQYPNQNSPYPGPNSPYPGTNSSSPGQTSPYPPQRSPYPGRNSPYPGPNSPHPGNSPYPPANQPYPSNNSSYPGQKPPYPVGISPYPGSTSPYPNPPVSTTRVQSGTIGFPVGTQDEVTIPLLPHGARVPLPRSASPAPSAPPAAKPDDNDNGDIESNPPYNPEFMKANENKKKEDEKTS
ncbi:arrestin domain-containing protein 17-like [Achroia grisella]|uniref:arrestin domain-containing protein 17-like n=1 Tax=Achroia grisella TaxID=688607 RepID=UPI0027D216B0|nr:arrestin domain-containing protein 17-like [Achroia grisella]